LEEKSWKDAKTSLFWELKTQKNKKTEYTTEEALEYVAELNAQNYGNFDDWRLPTLEELQSIATVELYNYSGDYKAWRHWFESVKEFAQGGFFIINELSYEIGKDGWYWSGDKKSDTEYFLVNFKEGNINFHNIDQSFYVRCVRG
jgi:hypothetical protein